MPTLYTYAAFLSYSHADKKSAERLHRSLETYRIPREFVVSPGESGPGVPERLYPIFRDRDELPAAAELSTHIANAIGSARHLVVICSPAAVRSQWVGKEISSFKQHHGVDRVLAIIVGGEPNSADPSLECFPPELRFHLDADGKADPTRRAEPLAADARDHADGWHLAVLKLVAGMTGVPLRDLERRDARRQRQRVRRLQAAAATFALLAFFATVAALVAWRGQRRLLAQAMHESRQHPAIAQLETEGNEIVRAALALDAPLKQLVTRGNELVASTSPALDAAAQTLAAQRATLLKLAESHEKLVARMSGSWAESLALAERRAALAARRPVLADLTTTSRAIESALEPAIARAAKTRWQEPLEKMRAQLLQLRGHLESAQAKMPQLDNSEQAARTGELDAVVAEASRRLAESRFNHVNQTSAWATRRLAWQQDAEEWNATVEDAGKALSELAAGDATWRASLAQWQRYREGFASRFEDVGLAEKIVVSMVQRFQPPAGIETSIPMIVASAGITRGLSKAWGDTLASLAPTLDGNFPSAAGFPSLESGARPEDEKLVEAWIADALAATNAFAERTRAEIRAVAEFANRQDDWNTAARLIENEARAMIAALEPDARASELPPAAEKVENAQRQLKELTAEARTISADALERATKLQRMSVEIALLANAWTQSPPKARAPAP